VLPGLKCKLCRGRKVGGVGRAAAEEQDMVCSVLVTDAAGSPARKEQGMTVGLQEWHPLSDRFRRNYWCVLYDLWWASSQFWYGQRKQPNNELGAGWTLFLWFSVVCITSMTQCLLTNPILAF